MPISAKKIIEILKKNPKESFSAGKIAALHKKMSRSKKFTPLSASDMNLIPLTLDHLLSCGFLIKTNSSYKINSEFNPVMEIHEKTKRECRGFIGKNAIVIRKEECRGAEIGDTVTFSITDIKKSVIFAVVIKVRRKKESLKYGIVTRIKKGLIYSRLSSGEDPVITVSRSSLKFSEDDIVLVSLKRTLIAGYTESDIISKIDPQDQSHDIPRVCSFHSLPENYTDFKSKHEFASKITDSDLKSRKDFRKLFTVTIDGETAKDFDDAVSLEKKFTENVLFVHIADVSAYIDVNSPLDNSAMKRGTSYYLGNKVIPMLPEVISNDLCSLKTGEDKLTLTAVLTYNKKNELKKYEFVKSIIRVDKRLTYKSASQILSSGEKNEETSLLNNLHKLTVQLKKNRMKNGRIDMNLSDSELVYHEGAFTDIIFSERLPAHMIIEESMLSANSAAAHLLKTKKIPALYRVHEKTSTEKLYQIKKFMASFNINFRFENESLGTAIQSVLDKVKDLPHEHVINFIVLKSMMQAAYTEKPEGHFGLGFEDYTHFTSPIRRYPDLIVHRAIKSYIEKKPYPYTEKKLSEIGEQSSKLERIAQKAERDLFKLKSSRLMQNKIGQEFEGIISGISKFGIYVLLNTKPVEGMAPFKNMRDDYYRFNEEDFCATGDRTGKKYTIGDKIKVKLIKSDPVLMRIDFDIVINSVKSQLKLKKAGRRR